MNQKKTARDCFVANAPRNDRTLSLLVVLSLRAKRSNLALNYIGHVVRWISFAMTGRWNFNFF